MSVLGAFAVALCASAVGVQLASPANAAIAGKILFVQPPQNTQFDTWPAATGLPTAISDVPCPAGSTGVKSVITGGQIPAGGSLLWRGNTASPGVFSLTAPLVIPINNNLVAVGNLANPPVVVIPPSGTVTYTLTISCTSQFGGTTIDSFPDRQFTIASDGTVTVLGDNTLPTGGGTETTTTAAGATTTTAPATTTAGATTTTRSATTAGTTTTTTAAVASGSTTTTSRASGSSTTSSSSSSLASTGGNGTARVAVIGGLLIIVGAGVVLLTLNRRRNGLRQG